MALNMTGHYLLSLVVYVNNLRNLLQHVLSLQLTCKIWIKINKRESLILGLILYLEWNFTSSLVIVLRALDLAKLHGWENSLPCSGGGDKDRWAEKGEGTYNMKTIFLILVSLSSLCISRLKDPQEKLINISTELDLSRKPHGPLVHIIKMQPNTITYMMDIFVTWLDI